MAWQAPKTSWKVQYDSQGNYIGDYFNPGDYQRIKSNLQELKSMADQLYNDVTLPDIPDVLFDSLYYESYINALERSIDALRDGTYDPGLADTKIWSGNQSAPLHTDLNRIESSCLLLYGMLKSQLASLKKTTFILGGVQF